VIKNLPKSNEQIREAMLPTIIFGMVSLNVRSIQNIKDNMNRVMYLMLLTGYSCGIFQRIRQNVDRRIQYGIPDIRYDKKAERQA
jgi:hypothetical protein